MPASLLGRFAFGADGPSPGAFSVERLINFLAALGQDVEIIVGPRRNHTAKCRLVA